MGKDTLFIFFVFLVVLGLYVFIKGLMVSKRRYYVENFMVINIILIAFIAGFLFSLLKHNDLHSLSFYSNLILAIAFVVGCAVLMKNALLQKKLIIEVYADDFEAFSNQVKLALVRTKAKHEFQAEKIIINDGKTLMELREAGIFTPIQLQITKYREFEANDLFLESLLQSIKGTTTKSKLRLFSDIIIGVIVTILCAVCLYIISTI